MFLVSPKECMMGVTSLEDFNTRCDVTVENIQLKLLGPDYNEQEPTNVSDSIYRLNQTTLGHYELL